ncbi:MAG: pyridoxal phosphate-dependent aminotransferase [bacterium]
MNFSNRIPADLSANAVAGAIEAAQTRKILDLTESNPTRCAFDYPPGLLDGLGETEAYQYHPNPLGDPNAREALSDFLNARGQKTRPQNIILTSGTSEAYSFLFKLFGNPGDSFLTPTPGYPLLDHLLALEGLTAQPYSLKTEADWPLDLEEISSLHDPKIKGFISINPHNPTGAFLSPGDQDQMARLCRQNNWMVISDEVFQDYGYAVERPQPWIPAGVLSFRLGGLSKSLALPQLKLSWMVLEGPEELVRPCVERLELIADSYLSVGGPVQHILPRLLLSAPNIQKQIRERLFENRKNLSGKLNGIENVQLWPSQGGWYALIEKLGGGVSDDQMVLELLAQKNLLVHPGVFYDFPAERKFLVLSLLPPTDLFDEGTTLIQKYLKALH